MDSPVYADSSFLVSLLCNDGNSDKAAAFMLKTAESLPFNPLHRAEVRNALRNAAARGWITLGELKAAFRRIDADMREGFLVPLKVDWTSIFRRADDLSEKHAAENGQRIIDLLHVAIAIESGAKMFLSFDNRQRALAKAAGLKVQP